MIVQNLNALQVEKTGVNMTSFAGLPLILGLAHRLKLPQELAGIADLKERKSGYGVSDQILSLVSVMTAVGRALEDVELLRSDAGLKVLFEDSLFPAANTMGDFLRRFNQSSIHRLGNVSSHLVRDF